MAQRNSEYAPMPHNIEAEQALLGAILINNEACDVVSGFLEPVHFFDPLHGRIFEIAARLIRDGRLATPVTLRIFFEGEAPIGDLTVPHYLGRLAASATTVINAGHYGRTIHDLYVRRTLIGIGEDLAGAAHDAPVDAPPEQLIEATEAELAGLAERGRASASRLSLADALSDAVETVARAYRRDSQLAGLSTGLASLDAILGGLAPSNMIILAGRPAMGKSALAAGIALHVAGAGVPVGFFSLEMSAEQIAMRLLSERVGISTTRMRRGQIARDDYDRIDGTARDMSAVPLHFDQQGALSIEQVCARARRMKRRLGIGLLVVDYMQLITGPRRARDGRTQEVSEISAGLKALAKELDIPVLALSQLSRQVESREDKRPQLSDLRDSGAIEQDADTVAFVFRDEYYVARRAPKANTAAHLEWRSELDACRGKAEVIIAKHRHGPTGTAELRFDAALTRFSDPQEQHSLSEVA